MSPQNVTLTCDCCYHEEDIAEEAVTDALIGYRCIRCDDVMFTRRDWKTFKRIRRLVRLSAFLNRLFPRLFKTATYTVGVTDGTVTRFSQVD